MHLLLVEDNPADANLLQRALDAGKTPVDLVWLTDGVEALEYLSQSPRVCDLLLLDLSLPRLTGFEVLERLRARDEFKTLPILILSGSCDPADVERCYRAGANSYICKPVHVNEVFSMAETIVNYWSTCATSVRRKTLETKGKAEIPKRPGA
ncbi:MAG TPA: response regulator [Bryobacteraceae bacterium]|jgi:CheY-like chemotaxis protein